MLASHWSSGVSENIQRGYPYDPELLPMDGLLSKLAVHWIDWFISGQAPRAFPFNKGKRPRSRP